ncbi:MAG: sortase [Chloroflexi bacterium]|nr:sortase [Chloroflexota bacterium]
MPKQQKRLFICFSYLMLVLLPFLSGCGLLEGFQQAPPAASVAVAPAPPAKAPIGVQTVAHGLRPDRLQIPSIKVDTPVVELGWITSQSDNGRILSEWDVADNAAGWHKNSSLIGERGNMVMSGHNNINGAVFRALDQLKRGDQAIVWSGKQHFIYRIDEVIIVPEKYASAQQRNANAQWIGPFSDERLTLVSCWPRDDNTHRIIVIAYPEGKAATTHG